MNAVVAICLLSCAAVIIQSTPTGAAGFRQQVPVARNSPAGIFQYLPQGVLFDGYQPEEHLTAAIPWYYNYVAGNLTLKNVEVSFGRLTLTHDVGSDSDGNLNLNVAASVAAKFDYPWRSAGDEECHRVGELRSVGQLELEALNFALSFDDIEEGSGSGSESTTSSQLRVVGFEAGEVSRRSLRISGFRYDTSGRVIKVAMDLLRGILVKALEMKIAEAVNLFNWSA